MAVWCVVCGVWNYGWIWVCGLWVVCCMLCIYMYTCIDLNIEFSFFPLIDLFLLTILLFHPIIIHFNLLLSNSIHFHPSHLTPSPSHLSTVSNPSNRQNSQGHAIPPCKARALHSSHPHKRSSLHVTMIQTLPKRGLTPPSPISDHVIDTSMSTNPAPYKSCSYMTQN